ncbi:hypothetical protein NDU88_004545 [Pleurodeles waltl]|uniref:Uncharacterized protein n=1 Tax=Pleurodeles waltl TaxID=8319 RepID=A0AAV7KY19_PLEWA|nr:hypothetical protein NDU88_004545 [Pleurodeles waltl]
MEIGSTLRQDLSPHGATLLEKGNPSVAALTGSLSRVDILDQRPGPNGVRDGAPEPCSANPGSSRGSRVEASHVRLSLQAGRGALCRC